MAARDAKDAAKRLQDRADAVAAKAQREAEQAAQPGPTADAEPLEEGQRPPPQQRRVRQRLGTHGPRIAKHRFQVPHCYKCHTIWYWLYADGLLAMLHGVC